MKTLKIKFYLCIALFFFAGGAVGAQDLEARLVNLRYNPDSNGIVFDLQIRAGDGYVSGNSETGKADQMNIRYDIFLEAGMDSLDISSARGWVVSHTPSIVTMAGVSPAPRLARYRDNASVYPLSLNIINGGVGDFGSDFVTVMTVVVPVVGTVTSTAKTYFRQRMTVEKNDPRIPYFMRSAWTNNNVENGYFTEAEDFYLEANRQPATPSGEDFDFGRGFAEKNSVGTCTISDENGIVLLIYPNPADNSFFVEYDGGFCTVMLFDAAGKKVLTQDVRGKTEININFLSEGFYNVNIFVKNEMIGNCKILKL